MKFSKSLTWCFAILALLGMTCVHAGATGQPAPLTAASTPEQKTDTATGQPVDEDTFEDEEFADEPMVQVCDPLRPFNIVMHHFNDTLYFGVLRPVASAYKALVPTLIRGWAKNFFNNITGPRRMINCLLQGKGQQAEAEFVKFCMNTTVGILGLGNPAGKFDHLNPPKEDLGQTLAVHGIGQGFYVVWPILGPYTLRDTVGWAGDGFMHPFAYIDPTETVVALWAYEKMNEVSFRLGDYETLKEAAIDPYEAFRDAYLQYRKKQVQE